MEDGLRFEIVLEALRRAFPDRDVLSLTISRSDYLNPPQVQIGVVFTMRKPAEGSALAPQPEDQP